MYFRTVLASFALAALGAQAAPAPAPEAEAAPTGGWEKWGCLSDADANAYAANSAIFLSHTNVPLANATAQALFADDIVEYGDSINSLLSEPVSSPEFAPWFQFCHLFLTAMRSRIGIHFTSI